VFNKNGITDTNITPVRFHHPWHELEEYQPDGGMWSIPRAADREQFIAASADLMAEPQKFLTAMLRALDEWPKSCDVAFTTPGLNCKAWMGHAGCYLATGSPEETTRIGWHRLDAAEQYAANDAADQAICTWAQRRNQEQQQLSLFWGF
jgi:hypothetical protein